jgi:hypothetical protein
MCVVVMPSESHVAMRGLTPPLNGYDPESVRGLRTVERQQANKERHWRSKRTKVE